MYVPLLATLHSRVLETILDWFTILRSGPALLLLIHDIVN